MNDCVVVAAAAWRTNVLMNSPSPRRRRCGKGVRRNKLQGVENGLKNRCTRRTDGNGAGQTRGFRRELDRVLSSPGFSRNDRQSQFLRFLVERHLAGKDSELKESVIAVEVFGRDADYDPKLDAIVRTEAVRLSARLEKYYGGDGREDPLISECESRRKLKRARTA